MFNWHDSREPLPRGLVLYDGPSLLDGSQIIAIATLTSKNEKTGNMVQVWIIPRDVHPVEAVARGQMGGACGNCPHLGTSCYVVLNKAPAAIWRGYQRGIYPAYNSATYRHLFVGRRVRWGAYGDPAALPLRIIKPINRIADAHTGYSHQLFNIPKRRADALARLFMCSCDNPAQLAEANRRGWRGFRVRKEGAPLLAGEIQCPYATHGVNCLDCRLCNGTNGNSPKHIGIEVHGIASKIKNFNSRN